MSLTIPLIDFERYGLHREETPSEDTLQQLGSEITKAFETIGFCYIKNHGFEEKLLDDFKTACRAFYEQPASGKETLTRGTETNFGWVSVEREALNPDRPGDLKEAFNYRPCDDPEGGWPDSAVQFRDVNKAVYQRLTDLSYRLLDVLSIGLGLDKSFMKDCHQYIGTTKCSTTLRTLYYPPIPTDSKIKPGQIRLGEHSDYGSVTLLFQDDVGGLEVKVPGGDFIPVTPIPGTMLVNIGDFMQRWTSDRLVATKHRVLIPEAELLQKRCRQSVVFFLHPDDDYVVRCLDGSDKYEPISSLDYLKYRFSMTY